MDEIADTKHFWLKLLFILPLLIVVALLCAYIAVIIVLARGGNYTVATFPALAALLFILLPIWAGLCQIGKFDWLLRCSPRTVGIGILSLLSVGALVSYAAYKDVPPRDRNLPFSMDSFQNVTQTYSFTDIRSYTLSAFYNEEFLCRFHVPHEQVPSLAKDMRMNRVAPGTLPKGFWNQPPYWWQRPAGDLEEYMGGGFSDEGPQWHGWHAGAVYDPQTQTLYLWGQNGG